MNKTKLSLMMIVKDEAMELDRCLRGVAPYVDEVVVGWTGTNPRTKQILEKYNAKIYKYKWNDNFSDARNFVMQKCTGDWLFWCDADDIVENFDRVKQLVKNHPDYDGIVLPYLYAFDKHGACTTFLWRERIIKNNGVFNWVGRVHETLCSCRETKMGRNDEVRVIHQGIEADKKGERNLKLLEKEYEETKEKPDPRIIFYLGFVYFGMKEYKKALSFFEKYITMSGWDEEVYLVLEMMADIHREWKEHDKALELCFRAMKLIPKHPGAYFGLGRTYFFTKQWDKSIFWTSEGFKKNIPQSSIAYNPKDFDLYPGIILINAYLSRNKVEEARTVIQHLVKKYPSDKVLQELQDITNKLEEQIELVKSTLRVYSHLPDKRSRDILKVISPDIIDHPYIIHLIQELEPLRARDNEVTFYCGKTAEDWSPLSLFSGIGGSETALIQMAKTLAKIGYRVTVYNDCGSMEGTYDGVDYVPSWYFNLRNEYNIFIVWRAPQMFKYDIKARKKFLWLHDVPNLHDFTKENVKKIDKIFVLSKYHRSLLKDIPDDKVLITANGIEYEREKMDRNPYKCMFVSSPNRGLEYLLKIWDDVLKEVPEAELHVFYGWDTFDAIENISGNPAAQYWKNMMIDRMKKYEGKSLFNHGRVSKEELKRHFLTAGLWTYPTNFPEISCISAMEAQYLGAIPVTTPYAAVNETQQFGVKVGDDKSDIIKVLPEYKEALIKALKDHKWQEEERKKMMDWAKDKFNWEEIAKGWIKELKKKPMRSTFDGHRFFWIRSQCSEKDRIVDIGGNRGHTFEGFDRSKVTTVDIDQYEIENFVRADAAKLPFKDNTFDIAVLAEILEHVEDDVKVLKEASRVAKNKVVITVPNEHEWGENANPFMPAEEAARAKGMTIEEMARKDNPSTDFYTKDNFKHLHHRRYYTKEMLEKLFKDAGIEKYEIEKLYDGEFVFWTAVCNLK